MVSFANIDIAVIAETVANIKAEVREVLAEWDGQMVVIVDTLEGKSGVRSFGDIVADLPVRDYSYLIKECTIGYDDHDLLSSGKGGPNILQSRKGVMGDFIRDIVSLYRASLHPT